MKDLRKFEENPKKLFWMSVLYNLSALTAVITLFYFYRGLNLAQISFLGAIVSLLIILLEIPTGMLSDIIGRKKTIILGLFSLILYGLIYLFAHNFFTFVVGIMFFAIAMALFSGCITAMVYDSLKIIKKEETAKKHLGNLRSAWVIGAVFIPPLASYIAKDLLNYQFMILLGINLIGYILALIIAFTLQEPGISKKEGKKFSLLKESFHQLMFNKSLLKLSFNQGLSFAGILIFLSLLWQPYFQKSGIPIEFFGWIFAVSNILLFFLYRNVAHIEKYLGFKNTAFFTSFFPGIFFILMALFTNLYLAILGLFISNILLQVRDPLFTDYKNQHIKSYSRATVFSIISMFYSLIVIIIQPIIGVLADKNLSYAFIVLGIILIINPIIFKLKEQDIKLKRIK